MHLTPTLRQIPNRPDDRSHEEQDLLPNAVKRGISVSKMFVENRGSKMLFWLYQGEKVFRVKGDENEDFAF